MENITITIAVAATLGDIDIVLIKRMKEDDYHIYQWPHD